MTDCASNFGERVDEHRAVCPYGSVGTGVPAVVTACSVDAIEYRKGGDVGEPLDFVGHLASCPRTRFGPVELFANHLPGRHPC
jgi:hypothetical protein